MPARRNTARYTMRTGNRVKKFGITDNPTRRASENNQRRATSGALRKEGPLVTRSSARAWEAQKIRAYKQRTSHRPPGNKQG